MYFREEKINFQLIFVQLCAIKLCAFERNLIIDYKSSNQITL